MKRTIDEIYNIIIEKRDNAINDRERTHKTNYQYFNGVKVYYEAGKEYELKGEIEAYTDVIWLIESSDVLNDK